MGPRRTRSGVGDGHRRMSENQDDRHTVVRMESTWAPTVTLITKPGCHLCTLARDVVTRVTSDLGAGFEELSLADIPDPDPMWWEQIPVTLIDGQVHDYWRVSERRLRNELAGRIGAARSA